jgi:hypothetical protein
MNKLKVCPNGHYYQGMQCSYCAKFAAITKEVQSMVEQWRISLIDVYSSKNKTGVDGLEKSIQTSNYGYIAAKAARYLADCKNSENYSIGDFFHYPMEGYWNMQYVYYGCKQLLYGCQGLTPDSCFKGLPFYGIREMFEMFHYAFTGIEDTNIENVYKVCFVHKVEGGKSFAYCHFSDLSNIESRPFYFRIWINDKLKPYEKPIFITICEQKTILKICTDNQTCGIAAEYAYVFQKYPGCERIEQRYGDMDIDGKATKVDVLVLKLADGNIHEVIFDISDFKNEFEGFTEELKRREELKNKDEGWKNKIIKYVFPKSKGIAMTIFLVFSLIGLFLCYSYFFTHVHRL